MTEQIIREAIADKERQRDRVDDANRFGRVEGAIAVQRTLFDAAIKRFDELLATAVDADDLKEMKRELEALVNTELANVCAQQSKEILGEVRNLFTEQKITMAKDQLAQSHALLEANASTRKEIIRYGIGFALTVMASLAVIWLTK